MGLSRQSAVALLFFALLPGCAGIAQEVGPASIRMGPAGAFLGDLTWHEAEVMIPEASVVILPVGAGAKEHGLHLPMNADAVVLQYLSQIAVDSLPVVVAPPILHGWFPAFRAFPGTEVADASVFEGYVLEVARSLVKSGAQRLVILNTGISRATGFPLGVVAREIRVQEGIPTLLVSWDDLEPPEMDELAEQEFGGHADELETSIQLFLQPDLVHMDRAERSLPGGGSPSGPGYSPGFLSRDPDEASYQPTGAYGDPTLATVEKGRQALALLTREWLRALRGFSAAER
jgi:creatinine amidohydrolase